MNQELYDKVVALKEGIENSPEVQELNRLNALLEKDEEVMKLCYKKDMAVLGYEDALKHFGENSIELQKAQKILAQAKLDLDTNPLVKQYNEQYKIVKKMYDKINEEIFKI